MRMRKTHICNFNAYFWNVSSDHTKISEFDKLSLSNNISNISVKSYRKNHSDADMPITAPVGTIVDHFSRFDRLAFL